MKKVYILDGSKMESLREVHVVLKKSLELPSYYGDNLDALYDCLTEMDAEITILHFEFMKLYLGKYFNKFWSVFDRAQKENPLLSVKILS